MGHTTKHCFFPIFRREQPLRLPRPGATHERRTDNLKGCSLRSNKKINICGAFSALLLLLLTACGPTVSQPPTQQKITIYSNFQNQETPSPPVPLYRCGAWASNNAPGPYSTIIIYAKLTQNLVGISGGIATATAHFKDTNVALKQQPISDNGGYVTFLLPLEGRQPDGVPTTVDVSFNVAGETVQCTPAFFTPW
jgi:hypothetical protein